MLSKYAVIGNPIAQSKSPHIHTAFAAATGRSVAYERVLCDVAPGAFAACVDGLRAQGFAGVNVTAPFKLEAYAYANQRSPAAELAGACNALKFENEQALGENFDGVGLLRDVAVNLGRPLQGKRLLVLGAGGATRGLLLPFLSAQPLQLVVVNRTASKAAALVAELHRKMPSSVGVLSSCSFEKLAACSAPQTSGAPTAFDMVFNATSAGLIAHSSVGLPDYPSSVFRSNGLAYDLTYGKGKTPFLVQAQAAGAELADGVGMLAEQAAEAFAWWQGVRPETAAVIDSLRVPLN